MKDTEVFNMLATISEVIRCHETVARDIEARIDELRDLRACVLASIEPAHIVDDLQLVVPL